MKVLALGVLSGQPYGWGFIRDLGAEVLVFRTFGVNLCTSGTVSEGSRVFWRFGILRAGTRTVR